MDCSTVPSKVIATAFALTAFVAALVVGYAAGNSVDAIIARAIAVMAVCWFVGRVVAGLVIRTVDEHLRNYKAAHPIPQDPAEAMATVGDVAEDVPTDDSARRPSPAVDSA